MKLKPSVGLVMYHMVCHVPVPSDSLCPWLQRPRVAFVSPAHTRSRLHFYTIQAPDSTLMNLKVGNRRISIIGARAKERVNTEHLPRHQNIFRRIHSSSDRRDAPTHADVCHRKLEIERTHDANTFIAHHVEELSQKR